MMKNLMSRTTDPSILASLQRQQAAKDAYMSRVTSGGSPVPTAFTQAGSALTRANQPLGGMGGVQTLGGEQAIGPTHAGQPLHVPGLANAIAAQQQPPMVKKPEFIPNQQPGIAQTPVAGQPAGGGQAMQPGQMDGLMQALMNVFQNGRGAFSQFTTKGLDNLYGAHGVNPNANFATSASPTNYLGLFSQSDPFWGQNIGAQMPVSRNPMGAYPYPEYSTWDNFRGAVGSSARDRRNAEGASEGGNTPREPWPTTDIHGRPINPGLLQAAQDSGASSYQEWLDSFAGAGG